MPTKHLEAWAPRALMALRLVKNRHELFGLHGAPNLLTDLIPRGSVAIDVGAARGLYAEWMAKKAARVEAFEANPNIFRVLKRSTGRRVNCHNIALSSTSGVATLQVPETGLGEASLNLESSRGAVQESFSVDTRTLDSYGFENVGFLKVDVEGHEEEVLEGAKGTLETYQPTVFIEIEERHRPGALSRIVNMLMSTELGYDEPLFLLEGRYRKYSDLDLDEHQSKLADTPSDSRYVSNFVFLGRGSRL